MVRASGSATMNAASMARGSVTDTTTVETILMRHSVVPVSLIVIINTSLPVGGEYHQCVCV